MRIVEKRAAVEAALANPETSGLSDREIARRCGVSHTFVARMRGPDPQSLCSDSEARAFLGGISETTARNWRREGKLPFVRIGGRVLYKWADLHDLVAKSRVHNTAGDAA